MPIPQTSYADPAVAFEGLVQEAILSIPALVNGESSAAIPFGVMVKFGATANEMLLLSASTDKMAGVLQFGHDYDRLEQLDGTVGNNGGIKIDVPGTLLRNGLIWVWTETAVVKGDPVHVRYAAGAGGSVKGRFRNASVASETIDLSAVAMFQSAASANSLALISLSLQ